MGVPPSHLLVFMGFPLGKTHLFWGYPHLWKPPYRGLYMYVILIPSYIYIMYIIHISETSIDGNPHMENWILVIPNILMGSFFLPIIPKIWKYMERFPWIYQAPPLKTPWLEVETASSPKSPKSNFGCRGSGAARFLNEKIGSGHFHFHFHWRRKVYALLPTCSTIN